MKIAFLLSKDLEILAKKKNTLYNLEFVEICSFYFDNIKPHLLREEDYDIVFYDMSLPMASRRKLYKKWAAMPVRADVVLLSNYELMVDFKKLHSHGVNAIITRDLPIDDMLALITDLLKSFSLHGKSGKRNASLSPHPILTDREKEILKLFLSGSSYKEVGFRLNVKLDTVRSHIRNIYKKLKVRSKTEAVIKVMELKIIN